MQPYAGDAAQRELADGRQPWAAARRPPPLPPPGEDLLLLPTTACGPSLHPCYRSLESTLWRSSGPSGLISMLVSPRSPLRCRVLPADSFRLSPCSQLTPALCIPSLP
jgi:hypothetical protein